MTLVLTQEQKDAGWQIINLGNISPLKYGKGLPQTRRVEGDIKVYSSAGWTGNHNEFLVDGEHIVIGRKGTVGSIHWAPGKIFPIDTTFYTSGSDHINLRWLYYLLKTIDFAELNTDSAVPGLNRGVFEDYSIFLPSKAEQDRIAEILGSVDDKIEANSRLLDSLYKLLHELYILRTSQSSQEISLTGIADFVNGKAFTKNATGTGRMVVRIAELNGGPGASTVYNEIPDVEEKHLVNPGEILMSWSGTLGVFLWSREQAIVNQHIFKVIPKSGYSMGVVYCAIQSVTEKFQAIAQDQATTMGHIKRRDLETPVLVPSNTEELENLFSLISTLEQENNTLAETRDRLIRYLIG